MHVILPWPPKALSPNARPHFMAHAKAKKLYRYGCCVLAKQAGLKAPADGLIRIDMTFYPPSRRSRDRDNLIASMKAGLDGIADALGVNDNRFVPFPPVISDQIGGMVKVEIRALMRESVENCKGVA